MPELDLSYQIATTTFNENVTEINRFCLQKNVFVSIGHYTSKSALNFLYWFFNFDK